MDLPVGGPEDPAGHGVLRVIRTEALAPARTRLLRFFEVIGCAWPYPRENLRYPKSTFVGTGPKTVLRQEKKRKKSSSGKTPDINLKELIYCFTLFCTISLSPTLRSVNFIRFDMKTRDLIPILFIISDPFFKIVHQKSEIYAMTATSAKKNVLSDDLSKSSATFVPLECW